MAWYRTAWATWLAAVLFPPLGLVLLWLRSAGLVKKILGSITIAILGVAHLFLFWGLHLELDGSGMRPMFVFGEKESHYRSLEQSRRQQKQQLATAAAPPAATPPANEPPAAAASKPDVPARPADYWIDFRGPNRAGRYEETPILTTWPASGLPRLWRQPVGGGYASFVVAGGLAFTIEQRRNQEVVAAYALESGREVWTHAWAGDFRESMGGDGPRATPVLDQGRLYALGAEGELRCLESSTGKLIWSKNILRDNGAENVPWGMANSPLIVDEKVIVTPGGPAGNSVVAYHKLTGERIWGALDDKTAYTSPMAVTLAGRRQILVVTARRAAGLTLDKGALLWEFPWTTEYDVNSAQPILVGPSRFFISAGYGHGAALVEVGAGGARQLWFNTRMKNRFNSSVLHQGHIYGMDEAIMACIEAETGALKWKGGRYGYGQILLAGGHLVVLTETGDLVLVRATPERHEELARFAAIEGKTWNHPAIAGGLLLVRNTTEMACFRIGR